MRILLVAATEAEVAPIVTALGGGTELGPRVRRFASAGQSIDVLVSGVGMVATAAWSTRALGLERYDFALNAGVCGSFDPALTPGTVVHVVSDRLAELGAEDGDAFLTLQQMHLLDDDEPPFTGGRLVNQAPPANSAIQSLPAVDGITVNTVHGNQRSIACVTDRFAPQVESMEGAAFMYACLIHGLPFAQVRAVSNVVAQRNRSAWRLSEAIGRLGETAIRILEHP